MTGIAITATSALERQSLLQVIFISRYEKAMLRYNVVDLTTQILVIKVVTSLNQPRHMVCFHPIKKMLMAWVYGLIVRVEHSSGKLSMGKVCLEMSRWMQMSLGSAWISVASQLRQCP